MDRLKIIQFLIFGAAILIVLRLFYWQFIAQVDSASSSIETENKIPADRGEIFASDGFPLVTNQQAFLLFARPFELRDDSKKIAKDISSLLVSEKYATAEAKLSDEDQKKKEEEIKAKEGEIASRLSAKNLFWVQLARKIPLGKKEKIEKLNLNGLGFEPDSKRFYPEASMAAHLLGFVGSDKFGDDTGYFGLEGYYDKKLRGQSGRASLESDPFGFPILVGRYKPLEPKKGISLYLTIDRAIQFIVEKKLRESVQKYGAKEGTVVVSDPKTGHILAMATYPNYTPAIFSEFNDSLFRNPSVGDTYEPGSTFKLITMSSALDLGLVEPNTRCNVCSGPRQISGYEISTWNKKYYPNSTMTEVIQHSDNIGMTYVADKLGVENFHKYINKFGFGKTTDIDLQEEATGTIRDKDEWKQIDLATASFGQGIAVTPIQMVQAVGAIANKGKLISPQIVEKTEEGGKIKKTDKASQIQVISPKTASLVTEMMVNAVNQGEAKAFVLKGFRIAGKTGTAQIPVAGNYDPNKTIASFIGFAPADDPLFLMLVRFREPSSSIFGSETAAPTFFSIAKDILSYKAVSPTE